jgi:guanylate kinase
VAGPSGVGKTEIIKQITEKDAKNQNETKTKGIHERTRTTTTRKIRPNEPEDAYFFITKEQFAKGVEEGIFLETAEYAGEMYGTSRFAVDSIIESGNIAMVAVDINGAKAYKEIYGDAVITVFVYRDKRTVIEAIMNRNIPIEEKSRRIMQLDNEYNNITYCDRCVINNGTIEDACKVVESFEFI